MQLRTLVTGANGVVGRVLRKGLADLHLTFTGRAQVDVNDGEALLRALHDHEQVVHLATPLRGRVWTEEDLMASVRMVSTVLDVVRAAGMKRVVIPSSLNATSDAQLRGTTPAGVADSQAPETEYGRTRLQIERLARAANESGLDVVCVRLGAVRRPDFPPHRARLRKHWLSHEDCAALFRAILTAPVVPGRFSLFYAVSDLPDRILDTANPFGWTPQTQSVGWKRTAVAKVHQLNTGIRGRLKLRTRLNALRGRFRG